MRVAAKVNRHGERLAVLEAGQAQIPDLLAGIRDEIKGMREDAKQNQRELYAHIDAFRREVKEDLKGKADKV